MTAQELQPPTERECERCGRRDVWDVEDGHWRIVVEDGTRLAGDGFCIHEWDVNGSYNPFKSDDQ